MGTPYDNKKAPTQVDHFNKLIDQANERNSCDEQCQYLKKSTELKEKYMQSIQNKKTSSHQIEEAQQNYIVFTKGRPVYDEVLDDELTKKAQEIGKHIETSFGKETKKIIADIHSYNVLLLNHKNLIDLYKKYKAENLLLKKKIKDEGNDILTNERKTFYENQGQTTLNTVFYVLTVLYIICLVAFLIFVFAFPSDLKLMSKLGIFVGLIVLYFLSPYILSFIVSVAYFIYNALPKNVHLSV
uniref:Uncharacterized protein n=1 Tax=viral metagenome TaxID=1070528 RepID=A0A6C0LLZ6_9ZZZZ